MRPACAHRAAFDARGLPPFEYVRRGEVARMNHHEAPAGVFDDRDEAARWGRLAWDAPLRSAATAPTPARARKALRSGG